MLTYDKLLNVCYLQHDHQKVRRENMIPDMETREHEINPSKEEDVILKFGKARLYFQNYYTIISLTNDILTGTLYLTGSIMQLYLGLEFWGMNLFIFASILLLMRPILKILHNVHIYSHQRYRKEVLGENVDEEDSDMKAEEGDPNKETKEVEVKKDKEEEEDKEEIEEQERKEGKDPEEEEKRRKEGRGTEASSEKESNETDDSDGSAYKSQYKDENGEKEFDRDYNEEYYG